MKASEFDEKFDSGKDVSAFLDLTKAEGQKHGSQRINLDAPRWMIEKLDNEASRLGVSRQSVIKLWLAEKLDGISAQL